MKQQQQQQLQQQLQKREARGGRLAELQKERREREAREAHEKEEEERREQWVLTDLRTRPELNGQSVTVGERDTATGRTAVTLPNGTQILVNPKNIVITVD